MSGRNSTTRIAVLAAAGIALSCMVAAPALAARADWHGHGSRGHERWDHRWHPRHHAYYYGPGYAYPPAYAYAPYAYAPPVVVAPAPAYLNFGLTFR